MANLTEAEARLSPFLEDCPPRQFEGQCVFCGYQGLVCFKEEFYRDSRTEHRGTQIVGPYCPDVVACWDRYLAAGEARDGKV